MISFIVRLIVILLANMLLAIVFGLFIILFLTKLMGVPEANEISWFAIYGLGGFSCAGIWLLNKFISNEIEKTEVNDG